MILELIECLDGNQTTLPFVFELLPFTWTSRPPSVRLSLGTRTFGLTDVWDEPFQVFGRVIEAWKTSSPDSIRSSTETVVISSLERPPRVLEVSNRRGESIVTHLKKPTF